MRYRINISRTLGINWYKNNKLHRLYGHAVEYANDYRIWSKDGCWYTKEGFDKLIQSEKNEI